MSAAQMNAIEFHTWNAVKTATERPDRLILDLDPGEGVRWQTVQQAAQLLRVLLQGIVLVGRLKTRGGKGLPMVVPLRRQYEWAVVKGFSAAMVRHLARTLPQLLVAKSGPTNRVGKIFVDYLRNGFGATTAAAWSARARPGLGISVPLSISAPVLERVGKRDQRRAVDDLKHSRPIESSELALGRLHPATHQQGNGGEQLRPDPREALSGSTTLAGSVELLF